MGRGRFYSRLRGLESVVGFPSDNELCAELERTHLIATNLIMYSASGQLAMQSAELAIVNPSVCPSVTRWHCQNDSSYDHGVFTVG